MEEPQKCTEHKEPTPRVCAAGFHFYDELRTDKILSTVTISWVVAWAGGGAMVTGQVHEEPF